MPRVERVDRRIWWLTVSKAADRSSRISTDDLESAFAIRNASLTDSSTVSVEWPLLKPDWLASSLLFCERTMIPGWKQLVGGFWLRMEGEKQVCSYLKVKCLMWVFWAVELPGPAWMRWGRCLWGEMSWWCEWVLVKVWERFLGEGVRGLGLEDML